MQTAALAAALTALLLVTGACEFSLPAGEAPPARSFYYPTALASGPGGADSPYAYVVSSNFDQRFRGSWVSVLDVQQLVAALQAPTSAGVNARSAVVDAVTVPSLAGRLLIDAAAGVGFVGHRGSATITALEVGEGGAELACGNASATSGLSVSEQRSDCDNAHLVRLNAGELGGGLDDADVVDPFTAARFDVGGESLLAVGYLSSAHVSIFGVGGLGDWLSHRVTTKVGVGGTGILASFVSAAVTADTFLVAGKQSFSGETQAMYAIDAAGLLAGSAAVALGADLGPQLGSSEVSDLVFSPDGAHVFVASAAPPAIISLTASIRAAGSGAAELRVEPADVLPLGGPPAALAYVERPESYDLLAATSIEEDAVYLLRATSGVLRIVYRVDDVGAGPVAVLPVDLTAPTDPNDPNNASVILHLLLVATFFDHGVTVLDISSADPFDFRNLGRVRNDAIPIADRTR